MKRLEALAAIAHDLTAVIDAEDRYNRLLEALRIATNGVPTVSRSSIGRPTREATFSGELRAIRFGTISPKTREK